MNIRLLVGFNTIFLLATVSISTAPRTRIEKITRWKPRFGTVRSVVLWHECLEKDASLPGAIKTFNFTRSEHVRALAQFVTLRPRAVLDASFDSNIRAVAAFFSEQISTFAEQTKKKDYSVTCLFNLHSPLKKTAVTVTFLRSKSQEIQAEVTFHGYLRRPPQELVQLVTAALIDDAPQLWKSICSVAGLLFAWWKWSGGWFSRMPQKQDNSGLSVVIDQASVDIPSVEKLTVKTVDVQVQTDFLSTDEGKMPEKPGVGASRRSSGDGESVPAKAAEIMPEITPEALHHAMLKMYDDDLKKLADTDELLKQEIERLKTKTSILKDGSILFACKAGTVRVVIHKSTGRDHPDLKRLWEEWSTKQVESDMVVVVYFIESKMSYSNLSELHRDTQARYAAISASAGCPSSVDGFAPCVLLKYISPERTVPTRWCEHRIEGISSCSCIFYSSEDGLLAVAKMVREAISRNNFIKGIKSAFTKGVKGGVVKDFADHVFIPKPLWGPR